LANRHGHGYSTVSSMARTNQHGAGDHRGSERRQMQARFGLAGYAPRKSSARVLKERASAMSAAVD
jgi:hypothetical protein